MKMTPVKSSNIFSIGYDEASRKLQVSFKDPLGNKKATYVYYPVEKKTHSDLMSAKSKGKFFNTEIKSNRLIAHDRVE